MGMGLSGLSIFGDQDGGCGVDLLPIVLHDIVDMISLIGRVWGGILYNMLADIVLAVVAYFSVGGF